MKEFLTVCPRNCYSSCSFRVFTEGNRIVRILPYPSNRATPEGPCIKGLSYLEREQSPERLLYPLRRNNKGHFERISTSEAYMVISSKLIEARERYGPQSVLFYKGSGISGLSNDVSTLFWRLFGGATTTYGNLCWPAGLEAVKLTLGEVKHNVPWDLANAQLIIIWGKNPAETNVQEMIHIDKAIKNGARLVVIDPRRTATADKADMLFRPLPGTDAALALAIAGVLIENNLTDNEFITRHVIGFNEFRASLDTDINRAEQITGIAAADIRNLALLIGRTDRVTIVAGYGLQRYTNGGQTIRSILSIPVITGKIGKKGCGFNYANLQGYIFDDIREPESYYPDTSSDAPFRRKISMARFADDFFALDEPPIEVAWIERGNPFTQLPGGKKIREAFNSIPFKVVVDQFITDTAAAADIILPAKGLFEQSDIVSSYWNPYVHFKPRIIDPPGEVAPESEIYYALSEIMNLCHNRHNPLPEPGNDNFETWLSERIAGYSRMTIDDLKKGPVIPAEYEEIAWHDMIFPTPSGKIELYSGAATLKWNVNALPSYIPVNECDDRKGWLRLMTPNIGSRIHSQFGNMKVIKEVTEPPAWQISPDDARKLNLNDNDLICVSNDNGSITGIVHISSRIRKGSIVFPNGIWFSEGGGVNDLITPEHTDMGLGAAFHDTLVKVEKKD